MRIDNLFFIRNNVVVHKVVRFDRLADKEIKHFPHGVQAKIKAMVLILQRDGKLEEPFGKKIDTKLYEIRIRLNGQWRLLYAYLDGSYIIILSAFQKKTIKTPIKEIQTARNRLKGYRL